MKKLARPMSAQRNYSISVILENRYLNLINIVKEKWYCRVKQFGLLASLKQLASAMVKILYRKNEDIVLAVIDHSPQKYNSKSVKVLAPSLIGESENKWGLPKDELNRLRSLLSDECTGFFIEEDGQLAAYAFVQFSGIYRFGKSGTLMIPKNAAVLKNLYVFSRFRGRDFGKNLNEKRLYSIPEGVSPLGFVIPENRYALRNLKMYGFTEILKVKRTTLLSLFIKQKVTLVEDIPISHAVVSGLQKIANEV